MRFLITAGPTREALDPVRYISNRSSGKMGYAIADAAIEAGHNVVLISGPVNFNPPDAAKLVSISTSDEMFEAVNQHIGDCDILVMSAAVADYKPATVSKEKIKKSDASRSLPLAPTRDILASLPRERKFLVVGFAAETQNVEANALKKLHDKNCDLLVANDARIAMESDENEVLVLFRNGKKQKISRAPKKIVARELIKIFENVCEKGLTKKIT
ncbi:MAG TPA: phosphopantothenoylcysteine decarboxylase [Chthoniobacterales bacterium]|nr:phosphopantothenoylcysteine decarboxylase [Chthoniobacterales bacterium]